MARAIQLSGEPALGIHCGLVASESSFGLMGHLVPHAPSLRGAIELVSQFHGLIVDAVRIQLTESMGTAQLRCALYASVDRSLVELMAAGLVRMLRTFGCGDAEITAVCFEHKRPAYHHAYTLAFRGAERFAQPFIGVEFAAQALDRPHVHWEPELHALMRAQAERGLSRLSRPLSCAERVRALMRRRKGGQAPDMAIASRELGISVRSLRRRLEEEGTSYRELTQSMIYESACSMLRNPDLTVQSIAHALGFADSSTFHRAFMRWAGQTPVEYREASAPRSPSAVHSRGSVRRASPSALRSQRAAGA
jgi:AraC-like DNA-binding protein